MKLIRYLYYKFLSILIFKKILTIYGNPNHISIGKNTRILTGVKFHLNNGKIIIGDDCEINHGVILNASGGKIQIGNKSSLNPYCVIYGDGDTIIGNYVRVAAHTIIVSSNHNYIKKDKLIMDQGFSKKGILIEDDVWIGAGVKILDGSIIRKGAIIAAGSIVNSEIPEYSLCIGMPARPIKFRN